MRQIYLTFYGIEPSPNSQQCITTKWYYEQEFHKYIYNNSSVVKLYHFELIGGLKVGMIQDSYEATVLNKGLYQTRWEQLESNNPESLMDFGLIECKMIRNNGTGITELDFCNYALSGIDMLNVIDPKYKSDYKEFLKIRIRNINDPNYEIVSAYQEFENDPISLSFAYNQNKMAFNFLNFELKTEKGKVVTFNGLPLVEHVIPASVYNGQIAKVLTFSYLLNKLDNADDHFLFNGIKLLDVRQVGAYYLRGIVKGLEEWRSDLRIPINREPSQSYINRLKHLYGREDVTIPNIIPENKFEGCSFVKDFKFSKISLKGLELIGYYTALTSQIEEFVDETGLTEIVEKTDTEYVEVKNHKEEIEEENKTNPYPTIFLSAKAYQLFCKLHEGYKNSKNPLSDFSFIYRSMVDDKLIDVEYKPEKFRRWLAGEPFEMDVSFKFKRLEDCKTEEKIRYYTTQKEILHIP